MVHQVFTGRGRGIAEILDRIQPRGITRQWLRDNGIRASALPRELSAAQWADLFALSAR
jgi:23S rRNA (adenine-N6)-dimethyltransferase